MIQNFPGRILLIDDDPDIREIYKDVLTENGFSVEFANEGGSGYSKILQGGYDLILLDIMMPKIDGITILEKLKEHPPNVYNGPIIILSQLNQSQIIQTALNLGAKGYLVKSELTPEQVVSKISELLKNNPAQ